MIYYYIPINLNIETVLRFLFEGGKKNEIEHSGINVGTMKTVSNLKLGDKNFEIRINERGFQKDFTKRARAGQIPNRGACFFGEAHGQ